MNNDLVKAAFISEHFKGVDSESDLNALSKLIRKVFSLLETKIQYKEISNLNDAIHNINRIKKSIGKTILETAKSREITKKLQSSKKKAINVWSSLSGGTTDDDWDHSSNLLHLFETLGIYDADDGLVDMNCFISKDTENININDKTFPRSLWESLRKLYIICNEKIKKLNKKLKIEKFDKTFGKTDNENKGNSSKKIINNFNQKFTNGIEVSYSDLGKQMYEFKKNLKNKREKFKRKNESDRPIVLIKSEKQKQNNKNKEILIKKLTEGKKNISSFIKNIYNNSDEKIDAEIEKVSDKLLHDNINSHFQTGDILSDLSKILVKIRNEVVETCESSCELSKSLRELLENISSFMNDAYGEPFKLSSDYVTSKTREVFYEILKKSIAKESIYQNKMTNEMLDEISYDVRNTIIDFFMEKYDKL